MDREMMGQVLDDLIPGDSTEIDKATLGMLFPPGEAHGEFQVSDSVLNVPALMDADTSQWEAALKNAGPSPVPVLRPLCRIHRF
jgi:hypothetical protein